MGYNEGGLPIGFGVGGLKGFTMEIITGF